jgi:DNA-binding GntR family transcriptional regulator
MVLPKYETKTEWTAAQIRSAILDGRVHPGDRLRIQDWARRLGVSATPVREAIKALEAEGYVRISAHRGAEVTAFTSKEFSDSFRLHQALDCLAAEFATNRLSGSRRTAVVRRLRRINEDLREALMSGDLRRADRANAEFHQAVYDAADSPLLSSARQPIWASIPVAAKVFWHTISDSDSSKNQLVDEHEDIIAGIERGDPRATINATRAHLESAIRRIGDAEASASTEHKPSRNGRKRVASAV